MTDFSLDVFVASARDAARRGDPLTPLDALMAETCADPAALACANFDGLKRSA